ncbi:MAG: hypothetical protein GY832_26015 [Chloroflexi bacterium]|nr:hypothetical protein [Chloroflexota bacterium]
MQSEFEKMLEDIIVVTGYRVEFEADNYNRWIHVWETKDSLLATYKGASFMGALKKAWQGLCG